MEPAGHIGLIPTRIGRYMACLHGCGATLITHVSNSFQTFLKEEIVPLFKVVGQVLHIMSVTQTRVVKRETHSFMKSWCGECTQNCPRFSIAKQESVVVCNSGVEGPPHILSNIMLSHTDDLVTTPYEIAPIAFSYRGLINLSVRQKGCCYLIRRI